MTRRRRSLEDQKFRLLNAVALLSARRGNPPHIRAVEENDAYLGEMIGVGPRQVQKYISELLDEKKIETRVRHWFNYRTGCWCNKRILKIKSWVFTHDYTQYNGPIPMARKRDEE